jgi:hypothetical protein
MTLITLIVGIAVAMIALLQWITARQKVVLDLFDKRFAVYEELREVISIHMVQARIDLNDLGKYTRAASRAQFLFGPEVVTYLEERRKDLIRAMNDHRQDRPPVPEERQKAVEDEMVARFTRLTDFFKDFDVLVAPYMKHTQKNVPIPYFDA